MPGTCVIGLQWGDEAKGKLVDILTEEHDLVVRYQGGANAGHTVVSGGQTFNVDGTSCSCPTFAGLVSLLNDVRLAAGKPTLGPLAKLFYANAGAFTDVTVGNNPGCGSPGFQAAKGWDPITGLGSPKFESLVAIVKALP